MEQLRSEMALLADPGFGSRGPQFWFAMESALQCFWGSSLQVAVFRVSSRRNVSLLGSEMIRGLLGTKGPLAKSSNGRRTPSAHEGTFYAPNLLPEMTLPTGNGEGWFPPRPAHRTIARPGQT